MEFKMIRGIITLLCVLFPATAFAGNAIKEISGYQKIDVVFSQNAHTCDLKDAKKFTEHLTKKLASLGIKQNENSVVVARLGIGGSSFGLIKGFCAVGTDLSFQTVLKSNNIVTKNQDVRAAVDRLGAFPVNLYSIGQFAVAPRVESVTAGKKQNKVDEKIYQMIDHMAEKIAQGKVKAN